MVDVEARVNDLVIADLGVHAEIMTQEEAVKSGAMALFGEKYGDQVRVISVGDWARELCGGTHAARSGQLGRGQAARRELDRFRRTTGGGAGRRRRLPVPGARARARRPSSATLLKVRPEELPERVNDLVDRLRTAEKEIEQVRLQQLLASAGRLVDAAEDLGGTSFVGHHAEAANGGDVRTLALDIRGTPARRPTGRGRRDRLGERQALGRGRGQRGGALRRHLRQHAGARGLARSSAARAAARTTSPRVAGLDASKADDALAAIRRAADRPLTRDGVPAGRRTARGGSRRRPDRCREQRPVGDPGHAGGDRGAWDRRPRAPRGPRRGARRGPGLRRPAALDVRRRRSLGR